MTSLELLHSTGLLAHLEVGFRLLLAAALAGLLGWDREEQARPAGLRTYMLVALAAAVFTVITFEIYETVRQSQMQANADPIRIIEAVTAGVAFLAAGVIIQGRNTVRGLTTGAGMWMAGALGVAAGTGNYLLAIIAALLAFGILKLAHFAQPQPDVPRRPTLIIETVEDEDTERRP
ncbi:MgtC/SapB transporter [Hyphomicrobium nitrativorans NL23]|uniref:Protein MgtC n=1 Tax=Hyphomicrobium nitrativorans NL23 TaxID=1029756 RepID=V5SGZ7_9HYPH|nr:MgtC/SapB family protein [Hyphomicrobium nitrativorans]AHB49234.1 MgtC/SapB transporter [Hyphomicrobium nitrativorans NL23]